MISRRVVLPAETTQAELDALIDELNADEAVDGMLVQLPVPDQLSEVAIANRIHPDKDVDGFSPINLGRLIRGEPGSVPCTPAGIMWLLDRAGVELEGAERRGGRPQPDRGQADGPAADLAQRDGDGGPLAHARPPGRCAAAPTCWWRPWAGPR